MWVIGVLGGIASGKSFVTEQFRRLGAEIIDADMLGHQVLDQPQVIGAIRQRWGDGVLDDEGHVNRAAVAKIVFAPPPEGPNQLAFLERLTHPRIGQRIRQRIAELAQRGDVSVSVLDAAVLVKAGWGEFCDKIVFVEASRTERLRRARQRGWSETDFLTREAAQEKLAEKRERADWVIDNGGSPEHTFAQVQQFWQRLD